MDVASNIGMIRGSLPGGVTLVAVSKFHPVSDIETAIAAGQMDFGESYVQELLAKHESIGARARWHMIGHLQTNKVRLIAQFVDMIQSVDSLHLAAEIDRQAERCSRVIDCLLEVHVAAEVSKTGWMVDELRREAEAGTFSTFRNIRFRGVMGMASNTDDESRIEQDFRAIVACKRELERHFDRHFDTISMGMSEDYEIAARCGSTMVRVGSSIFGPRPLK